MLHLLVIFTLVQRNLTKIIYNKKKIYRWFAALFFAQKRNKSFIYRTDYKNLMSFSNFFANCIYKYIYNSYAIKYYILKEDLNIVI